MANAWARWAELILCWRNGCRLRCSWAWRCGCSACWNGQPIGALDRWFGKITGFLSGLAGKLVRRQNWADDVLSAG
jgi:hypothetical protein